MSSDQGITALIVSLLSPSCFGHVSRLHHAYRTPAPDHLPLCAHPHCVPDWTVFWTHSYNVGHSPVLHILVILFLYWQYILVTRYFRHSWVRVQVATSLFRERVVSYFYIPVGGVTE